MKADCTLHRGLPEQTMADHWRSRGLRDRSVAVLTPHLALGALAVLAAAPIMLVAVLVPRALVLPALSLTAIAIAMAAGTIAWWRRSREHAPTVTLWDVAGAFMLIGCAAAMLSQPEHLLEVFGHKQNP
jgi:hypothetical protein